MNDRSAELEAELLEEIERQWDEADRAAGRVIRPARERPVGVPSAVVQQVQPGAVGPVD